MMNMIKPLTSCSVVIVFISLSFDFGTLMSFLSGGWKSKVWSSLSNELEELPPDAKEDDELVAPEAAPLIAVGPVLDSSLPACFDYGYFEGVAC